MTLTVKMMPVDESFRCLDRLSAYDGAKLVEVVAHLARDAFVMTGAAPPA